MTEADEAFFRWWEITGCRTNGDACDHAKAGWDAQRARNEQELLRLHAELDEFRRRESDALPVIREARRRIAPHEHGIEEP